MRVVPIFVVAILLSFVIDMIAIPRVPWRRRAPLAVVLHVLSVLSLCSFLLLLSARPVFSVFCALAWMVLLEVVSNAKLKTLHEPYVFSDLGLLVQSFRHPRLYFPALGVSATVGIVVAVVALALGYWAEPSVQPYPWLPSLLVIVISIAFGYLVAACLPLTLDPETDQRRYGFWSVVTAYQFNSLRPSALRAFRTAMESGPFAENGNDALALTARDANPIATTSAFSADTLAATGVRPDVIVIQSESYFDARRVSSAIDASAYAQFDRACRESVAWGELTVPAWGGNTMRSEFSFLTGLASEALGYARFYPYTFMRRAYSSLPDWFRRQGYRTVALHPYYADFFGRNRVFRLLHFDRFMDITCFKHTSRAGPYVADDAVADEILSTLNETPGEDVPRFIFTVTMENHGPLHLETTYPGESKLYHSLGEDKKWEKFTIYLRHIVNSDVMIDKLLKYLQATRRPTVVCFYGDHVPDLLSQFQALGVLPTCSAYFIWRNFGARPAVRQDVRIESLSSMMLAAMYDKT